MSDPLDIVSPTVTQLYGTELPTKRRAVSVVQGQVATAQFQFFDNIGNPVDLSDYNADDGPQTEPVIEARVREVITTKDRDIYAVTCTILDAETGLVEFSVPDDVYDNPGVYNIEFGVFKQNEDLEFGRKKIRRRRSKQRFKLASPAGTLAFTNKCYLWVDRGLFGTPQFPNAGPPSIDEIRLALRDNAPEENRLLEDFEFDLTELCYAAEMGVRMWNESQPPINVNFLTINYPVRDKWIKAICGQLFVLASNRYMRNHLAYQAGGLSVDDQNKFQLYAQLGMGLVTEYKEWVKIKRTEINCIMAMTSTGSSYGAAAYVVMQTGV